MSETRGESQFSPADADAIANAMAAGDSPAHVRTLRMMVRSLTTQFHHEQAARQDAESAMRGEIEALREELATQRRATAQMMRERGAIETVCSFCLTHMSGPVGAAPENTSHGICEKCLEEKYPEKVTA